MKFITFEISDDGRDRLRLLFSLPKMHYRKERDILKNVLTILLTIVSIRIITVSRHQGNKILMQSSQKKTNGVI